MSRKGHVQLRVVFSSKSKLKYKDLQEFSVPLIHFDVKKQEPKLTFPNYKEYFSKLSELNNLIKTTLISVQFKKDLSAIELKKIFIREYTKSTTLKKFKEVYFIKFANEYVKELRTLEQFGQATNVSNVIKHFDKFRLTQDILVSDITYAELLKYRNYCLIQGLKESSTSEYISKLRAIFNEALKRFEVNIPTPFKKGLIFKAKSNNRNIQVEDLKRLIRLKPLPYKQQRLIDLFMLTFYLRGHDLLDILTVKSTDVRYGRVVFKRTKLGNKNQEYLSIKIEPEAQRIIDKYKESNTLYLLPFLTKNYNDLDGVNEYRNFVSSLAYHRKVIRQTYDLDFNFSFKITRHTWASMARKLNIPYDVIKACLGHQNNDITNVYLAYDDEQLDNANRQVLDLLQVSLTDNRNVFDFNLIKNKNTFDSPLSFSKFIMTCLDPIKERLANLKIKIIEFDIKSYYQNVLKWSMNENVQKVNVTIQVDQAIPDFYLDIIADYLEYNFRIFELFIDLKFVKEDPIIFKEDWISFP